MNFIRFLGGPQIEVPSILDDVSSEPNPFKIQMMPTPVVAQQEPTKQLFAQNETATITNPIQFKFVPDDDNQPNWLR